MTTKVLKIQIVKPLDTDWGTLGKIFNDIQYETWKFSNRAMQMMWEFDGIGYDYFNQYKKSLKLKENPFKNDKDKDIISIDGYIYNKLTSELIEKTNSFSISAIIKNIVDKWKSDRKDVQLGKKSVANYKRDLPIEINNKQMQTKEKLPSILKDNNDNYLIEIKLISQKYAIELGRKGTETGFKLALAVKDNYQKAIVDRVISGEYKLSMSKLIKDKRKKKWFLNLAYTFTEQLDKSLEKNKIMGIDLGVNIPAMLAISDDKWYRQPVGDAKEIRDFQNQIKSRTKRLQQSRKWCGEGSIGHGVKTRIKPLEKLSGKIKRFRDTKNHCWSRYIVDEAVKHNCGTIQMEDLSGIAEDNAFLKTWTYYDLQQKIKYKAKEKGIEVVMIDPAHTSGRCSCCGHIHRSVNKEVWRPTQEQFICQSCGTKMNADHNAAKNIAIKDIDKIIKEQLVKQEKELKHNMKYAI